MSSQSAATKADSATGALSLVAEKKDLYEIGEIPPLGHVPKNMDAWAIRTERQGEPGRTEVVLIYAVKQIVVVDHGRLPSRFGRTPVV